MVVTFPKEMYADFHPDNENVDSVAGYCQLYQSISPQVQDDLAIFIILILCFLNAGGQLNDDMWRHDSMAKCRYGILATGAFLDREERTDIDSVPTDNQLSDTLLDQYKALINNQGLLVEEDCILKKSEISEVNKKFSFPLNFQVNISPFGTPEGITASSTLKNNDADLFIVEKRISDTLKPLFLMFNMTTHDSTNVDFELIGYLAESVIILTVNAQALLSRVRRNNISKEIYGSEVLQPIKIKDTPKMFDETER
ncbi:hypothetical protein ACTFIV_007902 [Dictyostelium citrinum]